MADLVRHDCVGASDEPSDITVPSLIRQRESGIRLAAGFETETQELLLDGLDAVAEGLEQAEPGNLLRDETMTIRLLMVALMAMALMACGSDPTPPIVAPTATPTPTPIPTSTSTATPSPTPFALAIPAPTTPFALAIPAPTSTPFASPTPAPTSTPTAEPKATPTPTAEDAARASLAIVLPWVEDPPDETHAKGAELLTGAWLKDESLTSAVAELPWLADGVHDDELAPLYRLQRFAGTDIKEILLPYQIPKNFNQGQPTTDPRQLDIDLLMYVAHDFRDDPNAAELLLGLSESVRELMADERSAHGLVSLAARDAGFALRAAGYASELRGDMRHYVLRKLGADAWDGARWRTGASWNRSYAIDRLTAQPWFTDGLTGAEAALITVLPSPREKDAYDYLLRTHYVQTQTISLPLAGAVNIWLLRDAPFPQNHDLFDRLASSARILEGLFNVPFPTNDLIALFVDRSRAGNSPISHATTHVKFTTDDYAIGTIPHEMAHYYFIRFPLWLVEGGADFGQTYIEDKQGVAPHESRLRQMETTLDYCKEDSGIENIMHFSQRPFFFDRGCAYYQGEELLLHLYAAIGEEAMRAALKELYLSSLDGIPTEEEIYDSFSRHAPAGSSEAFDAVYSLLHGFTDFKDIPDDHGDSISTATEITFDEGMLGVLDYRFDRDLFKFRAQEGQQYQISVAHDTLQPTSLWVYDNHGNGSVRVDIERGTWRTERTDEGIQALWTAPHQFSLNPDFHFFYAAVENYGGKTGAYTFTITLVE